MVRNLNPIKGDPTRTKSLRDRFERTLRRRFKILITKIEELLIDLDVFGLNRKEENFEDLVRNVGRREWSFLTDENKLREFEEWLKNETGLTIIPEDDRFWEEFVEEGYRKGAGRAFQDSKKGAIVASFEGEEFLRGSNRQFMAGLLGAPETVEKVKLLSSRVLTDLVGVTEVMATQLRKELADGLVQGDNPRVIARRMRNRISLPRTKTMTASRRAEVIARTEIIRAHSEGQLDALENLGVTEVGVAVEWTTAGDDRVCPLCADLEGVVLKTSEAHGLIPRHPQCRCSFVPANVGESKRGQVRTQSTIRSRIKSSVKREKNTRWAGARRRISKKRPESVI